MGETRLLLVEDDARIQRLLETQLAGRGYSVRVVDRGEAAIAAVAEEEPQLMILDIGLPDIDGVEVCRRIREWSTVPIILLTAADSPQIKVSALETGADDYLTKPFHLGELVARIRAVLRRSRVEANAPVIEAGNLRIDVIQRQVWRDGGEVRLTKMEFDLLRELAVHPDRVLTYSHLLETVWGPGYDDVRTIHVFVSHLRRKIEPNLNGPRHITTVPGVGYRFRLHDPE